VYVFSVKATDAAGNESDPVSKMWMIEEAGAERAQTFLTDGPRNKSWLLRDFVSFGYTSDVSGVDYVCGLNGKLRQCPSGQQIYTSLSSRTHTFKVAAVTKDGQVDRSPAKRTFTVPKNNNTLRHSKAWKQRSGSGYFLRTYSQTSKKGATLSKRSGHIKRIALVASKGKHFGTVKVFLGKKMLKKVSLQAKKLHKKRLVHVKTFKHQKRGTIRVVVVSRHKTVRIEGLGIATR